MRTNHWRTLEERADAAIRGLETALPTRISELTVGRLTFDIPELIEHARQLEEPWKRMRAAHQTIRDFMSRRPEDREKLISFLADLKIALMAALGRESEDLLAFGINPAKRRPPLASAKKAA